MEPGRKRVTQADENGDGSTLNGDIFGDINIEMECKQDILKMAEESNNDVDVVAIKEIVAEQATSSIPKNDEVASASAEATNETASATDDANIADEHIDIEKISKPEENDGAVDVAAVEPTTTTNAVDEGIVAVAKETENVAVESVKDEIESAVESVPKDEPKDEPKSEPIAEEAIADKPTATAAVDAVVDEAVESETVAEKKDDEKALVENGNGVHVEVAVEEKSAIDESVVQETNSVPETIEPKPEEKPVTAAEPALVEAASEKPNKNRRPDDEDDDETDCASNAKKQRLGTEEIPVEKVDSGAAVDAPVETEVPAKPTEDEPKAVEAETIKNESVVEAEKPAEVVAEPVKEDVVPPIETTKEDVAPVATETTPTEVVEEKLIESKPPVTESAPSEIAPESVPIEPTPPAIADNVAPEATPAAEVMATDEEVTEAAPAAAADGDAMEAAPIAEEMEVDESNSVDPMDL